MVLDENQVKDLKGLSENEVKERIKKFGYNEIQHSKRRGFFSIIFDVIKEPMFILLVACGVIYLILGDIQEALLLLGFVFVVMGITIYQENKTEKALETLRDLSSPRALVIRDGNRIKIAGKDVVKDDIVIVREGDRIPADATLLWSMNLMVDESLLTGESVSVRKTPTEDSDSKEKKPGGDDLPFVFSGTLVVQGEGVAQVTSIGLNTEMGKIGKALQNIESEETLIQKETKRLVKIVFIFAAILCLIIVVVYGITKGDWLQGILSGIALAMAMLPEEFPVVLTIFLALGAWRISKKSVLTRRISAVEVLGSSTVLCVDKTGTLTQNKMSVRKIFSQGKFYDIWENKNAQLPEEFHHLIEHGILASKRDPFDPMEKALKEIGDTNLIDIKHIHQNWNSIKEYPLSRSLLALSYVYKNPDEDDYIISAKGAPEAIADLCHLSKEETEKLKESVEIMAKEGLRVLGVAKASFKELNLPNIQHDFEFKILGLIGLADPIRESVPPAIQECYSAGVRVIMITGDYPSTAKNIAKQIGLKNYDDVITGYELEHLSPEELKERLKTVNIFARVVPEQKLLIVNALKENGEIVGMTGDGVNDSPALKSAHIGVAMGERGTDVARESSGIVLLNDNFSSIVDAIRIGRRIFDNLKKAMTYIISVHIPIAGASLLPVLFGLPPILFPVHIVFLELIIDPVCSIVFESEPESKNIMKRPPRNPKEPLFNKQMLSISLFQGIFSLLMVMGVFLLSLYAMKQPEAEARALAFATLVVSNLCLILTNRSWIDSIFKSFAIKNRTVGFIVIGALIFLILVIYVPFLNGLFKFSWMHIEDIALSFGAGILSVVWFEIAKLVLKKKKVNMY